MTPSLLSPKLPASITPAESAELAARLQALAESGLSLEGGLRALAEELGGGRLAGVLGRLAGRLENGEPLESAVAAPDCRLPVVLRGLIVAGVQSGRLPVVLDEFTAMVRRRHNIRQRLIATFAYPVILLSIIAVLLIFFQLLIVPEFASMYKDFGMRLPALTGFYLNYSGLVGWIFLGLAVTAIVVPAVALLPLGSWLGHLSSWIPIIGPIVRQERYIQFTRLMAALLEAQAPLPAALELAAVAMRGTLLAGRCRAASAAVQGGIPLDEALAGAGFVDSLSCLVAWGQKKNALAEAFRSSAESFEAQSSSQTVLLSMIVLPFIFLAIGAFVALSVIALFMPLISLITCLSSGTGDRPEQPEDFFFPLAILVCIAAFLLGAGAMAVMSWVAGAESGETNSPWAKAIYASARTLTILGIVFGVLLFAPAFALVLVVSMSYYKHVQTQQYAMLALIGAAAKRSMPLEPAIAAFGNERGGRMRQRARRVVEMMLGGAPLPVALEKVPGIVPPETIPLIRVGHDSGSLPAAIDQAIAAHNRLEPAWQTIVPKIGYICVLPFFAVGIIVFIVLSIVPQFQKIFQDFGLPLPAITRDMICVATFAGHWWFLFAPLWLLLIALLFYSMLRYAGWIRWDLPGMAWLTRRRHTATVLDGISLAAGQNQPLANAVMQLAAGYPQATIARRLWEAHDDMEAGGDDLQSLYRRGLLSRTDLALLQAALRNGNLAWAARELADSNCRRLVYSTNTLGQLVFPPIVVVYGITVALIAVALFMPLISLISNLSGGR